MTTNQDRAPDVKRPTVPRMSAISSLAAAGIGFDGSPLAGAKGLVQQPKRIGSLKRRHLDGLQLLDMDILASAHYGEPTTGVMYRLWRLRVYCRGFFGLG